MNNIVLVHGAFVDGSGWEGVYKILRRDGYNSQRGRHRHCVIGLSALPGGLSRHSPHAAERDLLLWVLFPYQPKGRSQSLRSAT
jgi:hypothetical protein